MAIEPLGRDTEGGVSSKSTIRSGPNRGLRSPETGGEWVYMGGFTCDSPRGERAAHGEWLRGMEKIGLRAGKYDLDGVTNLFVWMEDSQ